MELFNKNRYFHNLRMNDEGRFLIFNVHEVIIYHDLGLEWWPFLTTVRIADPRRFYRPTLARLEIVMISSSGAQHAIEKYRDNVLAVFTTLVSLTSGSVQIDLDEIGIDVSDLPKKSKKVWVVRTLPVSFVKELNQIRTRVRSISVRECVSCTIGWATSRERAIKVCAELDVIQEDFDAILTLCDEEYYERLCQSARDTIEEDATAQGFDDDQINILIRAVRGKQAGYLLFKEKLSMVYSLQIINLSESEFDPVLFEAQERNIIALRDNVMGELIRDVCANACDIKERLDQQFVGKGGNDVVVNGKTVKRFSALVEKVDDLSFVHPNLGALAKEMKTIQLKFANSLEALRGEEYANFYVFISSLISQRRVIQCLETMEPLIVKVEPVVAATTNTLPLDDYPDLSADPVDEVFDCDLSMVVM